MEFTRGFKLHHNGQVLDGAAFPSGRVFVLDDPEYGFATGATSLEELLKGYHGARVEWPPAERAVVLHEAAEAIEAAQHRRDDLTNERLGYLDDKTFHEHVAVHRSGKLLRRLADETAAVETRCPSCDHEAKYHAADDGRCWFTVDHGIPGSNLVCPCAPRKPDADAAEVPKQPVRHAPGKVTLCPDCRAKGLMVCTTAEARQDGAQTEETDRA